MKRPLSIGVFVSGMAIAGLALAFHGQANRSNSRLGEEGESRVAHGFEIAPVHLNLEDKDRELVGLGSYLVNGPGACNMCHTSQPFDQGGNPFLGQPTKIDTDHYLGGWPTLARQPSERLVLEGAASFGFLKGADFRSADARSSV